MVLMLGRKLPFPLRAVLSKKIPLVVHYPTGRISVRLVKEGEGYLELGQNQFVALPTIKEESNPHPKLADYLDVRSFWEGINKPAYFMDVRKAISMTPQIWSTLSKVFKLKAQQKAEIEVYDGEFLKPDDIIEATWKMYKPSVIRAISLESEEIGRREAGFNFGKFAVPLGLFIGIAIVLIVVYGLFIQWAKQEK